MTTLDKLNMMQATNAIKGKRTHPVGTYMLLGFIGLIVVAAGSSGTKPTASMPAKPYASTAQDWKNNNDPTSTQDLGARQTHGPGKPSVTSDPDSPHHPCAHIKKPGIAKFNCTMDAAKNDPAFRADLERRLDQILK